MAIPADEEKKRIRENEKHKDRSVALDRALKMSHLFKIDHFEKIMTAVNQKNETDFMNYVTSNQGAQLSPVEANWLWNYLKNYKENPNGAVTGW
jgi:hypothetical protein